MVYNTGYTGDRCELEINECESSPCHNGATCQDGIGNYTCKCVGEIIDLRKYSQDERSVYSVGWQGPNCEHDIDECKHRPPICLNNGICQNTNGSFQCFCPSGGEYFTGNSCLFPLHFFVKLDNRLFSSSTYMYGLVH